MYPPKNSQIKTDFLIKKSYFKNTFYPRSRELTVIVIFLNIKKLPFSFAFLIIAIELRTKRNQTKKAS